MPSYRFCRPDDIPFLVRAVNECHGVHFPDEGEMTVERFRREMKERSLWPSNSMVAIAGSDPIAVMIGSKREREVMVLRVGVRPDHQRRGHASHILTSLSQKLAVLGPPRLVAEVPADLPAAGALFRSVGYRPEALYWDYLRPAGAGRPVPEGLVGPVTFDELESAGALQSFEGAAWDRSPETLSLSRDSLHGFAIATPARIEAYLLYRESEAEKATVEILALASADPARPARLLPLLVEALAARLDRPLALPRLAAGELPEGLPEAMGFTPGRTWERLAATARPA